ncbi:hypothetical protein ACLVWU_14615 [Bdellovibrio sp. HCB290]|uniref:hypothetical protein n=1 Tax=Bdellovibrio sp. HCB290 TaxID=3394356 RepID=UPI0039B60C13
MKRPFYRFAMYSVLFVQASNAFAAQAVITPIVGAPVITASAGTYEINTQDSTQILQSILGRISQIQDSDLQFIQSVRQTIDTSYNELARYIVAGEFAQMSNKSRLSQSVSAEAYLTALTKIQEMRLALDSKIQSLEAITKGVLPSQAQISVGNSNQVVSGYRNIDMTRLVDFYNTKIRELLSTANTMQMKVALPTGGVQVILDNTLSPTFDVPLYSQADIEAMQLKISELRLPSEQLSRLMDSQANEARRLVQAFVTNYGSSERYRFKDDRDRAARDEAYKAIQDIFWSRSYLRVKYGMRLGAIQPGAYQKRWANVEKFTVMTESLRQFRQERAVSEVELADAAENMRNVLELLDDRSAEILGKNANASILVRANSFLTWIGGQTQTAEALLMISQLVAADIAEEQLMASAGGLARTREFYKTRYQSTEAMKAQYSNMKCSIDSLISSCQKGKFDDVVSNQGGLRQIFNSINLNLYGMAANLDQATRLEEQMKRALIANGGAAAGGINNRAGDL